VGKIQTVGTSFTITFSDTNRNKNERILNLNLKMFTKHWPSTGTNTKWKYLHCVT